MTSSLRLLAAAIALVAVVGGGAIWYAAQTNPPPTATQSPIPSFTAASTQSPIPRLTSAPTALPSPSQAPTPSTEVVLGWPTTSGSGPGLFSWDDNRCAGTSCVVGAGGGFMHNCYGPCDVAITISVGPDTPVAAGGTAVTIAGHSGWYRRVVEPEPSFAILGTPVTEEWTVEINRATVVIRLAAKPGASDAGLADAHAIIDSLRSEPSGQVAGFRLVFRLTNHDWDSG